MSIGIRGSLKSIIPEALWPLLRFFDKYLINSLYVYFFLKRSLFRIFNKRHSLKPQPISYQYSHIEFGSYPGDSLESHLEAAQIQFKSGRHSVYIESYEDIAKINPELTDKYPDSVALKLIKSQEISPDTTPYYTSHKLAPASTWFSMVAIGSMLEQAVVSNLLSEQNVAPRVYDIVHFRSESGSWRYAFVVQPIIGEVVTGNAGIEFVSHFKKVLKQFGMETISIAEHCDLRPPEFRHNIIGDTNGIYYVDMQNFVLASKGFGDDLLFTMEQRKLNNQRETGKTSIELVRNPGNFDTFFQSCGLDIESLVCIDLFVEDESLAIAALSSGCMWCHLARYENDISFVMKCLFYQGYSRFCVSEFHDKDMDYLDRYRRIPYPKVLMLPAKNARLGIPLLNSHVIEYLLFVGTEGESEEDLIHLHNDYELPTRILSKSCVSLDDSDSEVYSVLLCRHLVHK